MIEFAPPPPVCVAASSLWIPPKPAIIRAASPRELERAARKATFPFPIVPPGGGKALTFRGSANSASDLTTYTFSAQPIGSAAADRRVIVGVMGISVSGDPVLSSATIAGASADIVLQVTGAARCCVGIIIALVTTGTTGNVVLNFSVAMSRAHIAVWSCTGLSSNTAHDSDSSTADPGSNTIDTLAAGFAVGMAGTNNSSTYSWTNLTERSDAADADGGSASGADAVSTAAGTLAILCAYSASITQRGMVVASW
jgi:hypothetical protein